MAFGATIKDAAASAHISLRTANRRLADLRGRTGVPTNRKLVNLLDRAA